MVETFYVLLVIIALDIVLNIIIGILTLAARIIRELKQ
jgi:hypothetical protein